jgi:F0F1-type ATP synthase assembly protein I
MIPLWMILLFVVVGYLMDYQTADKFSKINWKAFRQYEQNKTLVWHKEQEYATQNKRFMQGFHINQFLTIFFGAILIGYLIKYFFNISFVDGMKIFLIAQILTNIIGIISNIYAILKYKEGKQNE